MKKIILFLFSISIMIVGYSQSKPKLIFEYHYGTNDDKNKIDSLQNNIEFAKMFKVVKVKSEDWQPYAQIRDVKSNVLLGTIFGLPNSNTIVEICKVTLQKENVDDIVERTNRKK